MPSLHRYVSVNLSSDTSPVAFTFDHQLPISFSDSHHTQITPTHQLPDDSLFIFLSPASTTVISSSPLDFLFVAMLASFALRLDLWANLPSFTNPSHIEPGIRPFRQSNDDPCQAGPADTPAFLLP